MREMLIPPSAIRRMDIVTLRERATAMQSGTAGATPEARQKYYNTYVKLTDEIARRHAKGIQHPLLIKRSDVYGMTAGELREQVSEMRAGMREEAEWRNTIALLEGEMNRRKALAKKTYARRKVENSCVNVVDNTATM